MPSYVQAFPFLLASFAMTSSATTTAVDGVRMTKNSKKQGLKNKEDTCTIEQFLGKAQYTNCKGTEIEVKIACDHTDDTATATTKKVCSYSEQPVQFDDVAAAVTAVGCGDHGSFDPDTHLFIDNDTGVCRIKFFRLTSTCIGAPASSGFGVMVEVPRNTAAGTGPLNHLGHNEDKNHKDNSGMQLRFSIDEGVTYYNEVDPRITLPFDGISPQRTLYDVLDLKVCGSSVDNYEDRSWYYHYIMNQKKACPTRGMINSSIYSTITWTGEQDPFQTCYKYGSDKKYCYSNSYWDGGEYFYQCVPNGADWHAIDTMTLRWALTDTECKTPCKDLNKKDIYWGMCPPVSLTDIFSGYDSTQQSLAGKTYNQQTCFQHGSEDKYCWTNSYQYTDDLYYICIPVPEYGDTWSGINRWKRATPKDGFPGPDSCGEPCQDMYELQSNQFKFSN